MTNTIPLPDMPPEVPYPPSRDAVAASRKKKAKKRLTIIISAVVVLGAALWYFQKSFSLPLQSIATFGNSVETSISGQWGQNFSAPSPLQHVTKTAPKKTNVLTDTGIVAQTNLQRAQNGDLPPLAENATLDDIATLRIDDMFEQQYFAHVNSSTGESAITVASSVGYVHLSLGENLALGSYAGDVGVVDAWMASPGHRANILDAHYTQIGVAVREGMFQGQETWIAVQEFGRHASDCQTPDASLEATINLSENAISAMDAQLRSDKSAIDAISSQSGPAYNAQVEDYNNLAAQYNDLVVQTKSAITTYDAQVTTFNQCLNE